MVAIVRKDLNILQRMLMGALIVIDVHARDVVTELLEKGVKNLNDFEFSKQLRYYWEV
jgi:dynein heavy chain